MMSRSRCHTLKKTISRGALSGAFLILSAVLLLSLSAMHKFYVSVTEIRWTGAAGSVQISMRIFPDDLDRALEDIHGTNPQIITRFEHAEADQWIAGYLSECFRLEINGIPVTCTYIGKEQEADAVWCYLEGEFSGSAERFDIVSTLLTDHFPDQVNIVQVWCNEANRGAMLDRTHTKATIRFQKSPTGDADAAKSTLFAP